MPPAASGHAAPSTENATSRGGAINFASYTHTRHTSAPRLGSFIAFLRRARSGARDRGIRCMLWSPEFSTRSHPVDVYLTPNKNRRPSPSQYSIVVRIKPSNQLRPRTHYKGPYSGPQNEYPPLLRRTTMDPNRRQQQAPNHQSGHHQTSSPYTSQQHGQYPQPMPNTRNDHPTSHNAHSSYPGPSYPEGSLQHPPLAQDYGSRSPHAGPVPFPEPQHGGSAGHSQAYYPPSQTMPNLSVAAHHQHERRGSQSNPPPSGPYSDSRRLYATGESYTGGGSNFSSQSGVQLRPEGGHTTYATSDMQPPGWNAAENEETHFQSKAPGRLPANIHNRTCRFPRCPLFVFFDRRVNETREWCGDQHMIDAIRHGVEQPCATCQVWPRRYGRSHCSEYCQRSRRY